MCYNIRNTVSGLYVGLYMWTASDTMETETDHIEIAYMVVVDSCIIRSLYA